MVAQNLVPPTRRAQRRAPLPGPLPLQPHRPPSRQRCRFRRNRLSADSVSKSQGSPLPISLLCMRRRGRRAILLFGAYAALLLAVVVAGFIGQAVGVWAAVVWGVAVIAGLILFGRRLHRPQVDP